MTFDSDFFFRASRFGFLMGWLVGTFLSLWANFTLFPIQTGGELMDFIMTTILVLMMCACVLAIFKITIDEEAKKK